ncbi:hypothetical protein RCH16_003667 [Cryobacterium sp. MP_M5]|nr:hypothetical protein [Cryobacterium sp. MP_M5]
MPADYRQRPVGADLAERVTAMHKSQVLSTRPAATEDDRQRGAAAAATATQRARESVSAPTAARPAKTQQTTAEALRAQFARKAELQREQLRRAGLNVKPREAGDKRKDERNRPESDRARDDGLERNSSTCPKLNSVGEEQSIGLIRTAGVSFHNDRNTSEGRNEGHIQVRWARDAAACVCGLCWCRHHRGTEQTRWGRRKRLHHYFCRGTSDLRTDDGRRKPHRTGRTVHRCSFL